MLIESEKVLCESRRKSQRCKKFKVSFPVRAVAKLLHLSLKRVENQTADPPLSRANWFVVGREVVKSFNSISARNYSS